jgi:hypothetical protein
MSSDSAASTQGSPERRCETRFPYHAGLEIEWGSAILKAHVREISGDGMFIEMEYPLWIGATFQARLALSPPLTLHCVVRRVEPGRGIGASVKTAEPEGASRLEALIHSLSAR